MGITLAPCRRPSCTRSRSVRGPPGAARTVPGALNPSRSRRALGFEPWLSLDSGPASQRPAGLLPNQVWRGAAYQARRRGALEALRRLRGLPSSADAAAELIPACADGRLAAEMQGAHTAAKAWPLREAQRRIVRRLGAESPRTQLLTAAASLEPLVLDKLPPCWTLVTPVPSA